jgi:hypothetical protein
VQRMGGEPGVTTEPPVAPNPLDAQVCGHRRATFQRCSQVGLK